MWSSQKTWTLSLHLNSDWKLPILDYTNLAARGESGLKKGQIIPECRLLMRFMAEDVKLEMTGAGAILQSNFLFPGWIKLDNSYTSLPSLFSVKRQCVQLIVTWQKKSINLWWTDKNFQKTSLPQIMMPLAIHSRKVTLKFTTSGSGCLWKNCGKVHDLIIISMLKILL